MFSIPYGVHKAIKVQLPRQLYKYPLRCRLVIEDALQFFNLDDVAEYAIKASPLLNMHGTAIILVPYETDTNVLDMVIETIEENLDYVVREGK